MKSDFYGLIENEVGSSVTENGAVGFKSSGHALLDLNFAVSSLRNASEAEIVKLFEAAYREDPLLAVLWLFFVRDCRHGQGERRLFRICMRWLSYENWALASNLVHLIPEYGRWDDVANLFHSGVKMQAVDFYALQLRRDMGASKADEGPISLAAKWAPTLTARDKERREQAKDLRSWMGMTPREYRKMLSSLRGRLDVVERKMSAGKWSQIVYPAVPSRANLTYKDAFLRHDEKRRRDYLSKVQSGEEKINASVLFPHDIVHQYGKNCYNWYLPLQENTTLEELWRALPNTMPEGRSTIVVADGSGSMLSTVGNTGVRALDVANALAIYFAERLPAPFKDKYITFSAHPRLVDLSGCASLADKLNEAHKHNECTNTNVEAVFDLLLETAVNNRLTQSQLPDNVLIISDLEFDRGTFYATAPVFRMIERRWKMWGYRLPRLVFWNVASRTGTIPVKENEVGVALVSGFSPNVARLVMSDCLDPYEALLNELNAERYETVKEAAMKCLP